jgi:hypothetical membrane protein
MRGWVVVSAGVAPFALIGGWSVAAIRQPQGYDPVRDTISALAARGAADSWIMTTGLAVLGVCHIATAAGLPEAGVAARALLAAGGAATIVVAAQPQPAAGHVPAAAIGFVTLALWPAASLIPDRRLARAAAAVLVGLLGWLAVELRGGHLLGLSERVLTGGEALWPLAVVVSLLLRRRAVSAARTRVE